MAIAALAALLIAGIIALLVFRRRRGRPRASEQEPAPEAADLPPVLPVVVAPEPSAADPTVRPAIELDFSVTRAGIEGEQLAVAFEISLRNGGEARADDIRVHVELRTVGARAEPPVAGPVAAIERPMVAPFALEPGAEAQFSATAVLPVARIDRLMLQGRPMCAPIVALTASYRWPGGGKAELGVDYLLGIGRPGNPRLSPIWLDEPPRLHERIGMRVHGEVRKR